jgi:osmotically-inducible protein OsmY
MFTYRRYLIAGVGSLAVTLASGCNQQDADCLSRIGRKVTAHARSGAGEVGGKFDLRWARTEPTLQEKIQDRLRFDNALTEIAFEVKVKDKEVELKGTVTTPLQRQHAVELAESVAGVDRVIDSLKLRETDEQLSERH